MKRENFTMEDGAVIVEYYGDGHAAHYILTGERFQHSNELLKLMLQYGGACTDNPKRYATAYACNYNCSECERSIYNIIRVKEKFFTKKCMELVQRIPRKNDEWKLASSITTIARLIPNTKTTSSEQSRLYIEERSLS